MTTAASATPAISILMAVARLLQVVKELNAAYPQKSFTLDGRLVGDIGEVLVAAAYDVELFDGVQRHHDGKARDGRLVQIKATMKSNLTFPAAHVPDFFIGIQIHADGTFTEVFNGPGKTAANAISSRKLPKTNLHSVSVSALTRLSAVVTQGDRIPRRSTSPSTEAIEGGHGVTNDQR